MAMRRSCSSCKPHFFSSLPGLTGNPCGDSKWIRGSSPRMTDKVCADAIRSSIALEVVVTEPDRTTPILLDIDDRSVARVVLNRPERNNAYDGDLIQALLAALDTLEQRS